MGRWSRKIAPLFLDWLDAAEELRWLDVGCGTGALSRAITEKCRPRQVVGIDKSGGFLAHANRAAKDAGRLHFVEAGAEKIPAADHYFDVAVSGLAINHFPDPVAALREMARVVRHGGSHPGQVALYVWDYAEGMGMLRVFWDVAASLDSDALALDQKRFAICHPDALASAFGEAGMHVKETRALETPAVFENFDDYWQPFFGGAGPASRYVGSLSPARQAELASTLQAALPVEADGSISLGLRAWAVRGVA